MSTKLTVPSMGESVVEAAIEKWLKKEGDFVAKDEIIVTIESDKATLEVPAPVAGRVTTILKGDGDDVEIGEAIAEIDETASAPAEAPAEDKPAAGGNGAGAPVAGPGARRAATEKNVDLNQLQGSGHGGRILKEDVEKAASPAKAEAPAPAPVIAPSPGGHREEETVKMTRLRKTIARRLLEATQSTAMLTTFNEVDMGHVMDLRKRFQDQFVKRYGIKLGFMSFFVKAAIEALKAFPAVNAEIRGDEIVYKNYFDIGVAVGSGKGLTVPVIRNAENLSFAQVEQTIADFAVRARENKLGIDELTGGTFTISNGGIYGSMLSTPILNPPQSGILGMHNIQQRAVVTGDGQIVARPMMYLALSYDHRIVDGREAVQFLLRIKECIENPERILLEV